jgi:hypothetical protein
VVSNSAWGEHPVAVEEQIGALHEGNAMRHAEVDLPAGANLGNDGIDGCGIDAGRFLAAQSKKHGAIRGMADSGKGKRPVEFCRNMGDGWESAGLRKPLNEGESSAHWPHGVRTGGADADFVQVKEARHQWQVTLEGL